MRNKFLSAFAFTALSLSMLNANAADKYTLEPTHTAVVWQVNHFGFSNPSGKFMGIDGTLTLDEQKPENSSLNVTIPLANVLSGVPKLDDHLKGKDFFNVESFPKATFVSNKVEVTGKDTAKVTGALTILGVAKTVTLDVKLNKIGESPITKKKTAGFSATTTIKRSDFGMKYGLPAVSDEVKINIEAEAIL